jgi:hypothetical protein
VRIHRRQAIISLRLGLPAICCVTLLYMSMSQAQDLGAWLKSTPNESPSGSNNWPYRGVTTGLISVRLARRPRRHPLSSLRISHLPPTFRAYRMGHTLGLTGTNGTCNASSIPTQKLGIQRQGYRSFAYVRSPAQCKAGSARRAVH